MFKVGDIVTLNRDYPFISHIKYYNSYRVVGTNGLNGSIFVIDAVDGIIAYEAAYPTHYFKIDTIFMRQLQRNYALEALGI